MSTLDSQRNDFEARLNDQVSRARQRQAQDRASLLAAAPALPRHTPAQVSAFDAHIAQHLAGLNARLSLNNHADLHRLDGAFAELFDLNRYLPTTHLNYPTIYCETLPEFCQALVYGMETSAWQREQVVAQLQAQCQAQAQRGGGIYGANIPGAGCYLNGWLFNYGHPGHPRDRLTDPRTAPLIWSTVAHEKLGHGFVVAFSALGEEKKALGLHLVETAQRFGLQNADTPAGHLLLHKHNWVHLASNYLEEGWATWIERMMLSVWHNQPYRPKYTLQQVTQGLQDALDADSREALLGMLHLLLLEPQPAPQHVLQAMHALQCATSMLDEPFGQLFGQPAPYVVGALLMDKVAARLGTLAVPYVVLLAANVKFDLAQLSITDLQHIVATNPRLNPDARLALLAALPASAPFTDMRALAQAAHQHLGFTPPAALRA